MSSSPDDFVCDGGSGRLSRSTLTAAEYLADTVAKHHGCVQGQTALYWAIIGVLVQHAKQPEPELPPEKAKVQQ